MPLFILSQEIDEAFLESLPEDVRKEVEEKAKIQSELDKPVYRRASTVTDKEKEEEEEKNKDKLKIFGKDIFDMMQSSFMPVNEPNVNESYTLDFGDVLQIQIVGQKNLIEQYPLQKLAEDGKLSSFKHDGFWQCMDTLRDKTKLNKLWEENQAPWKAW